MNVGDKVVCVDDKKGSQFNSSLFPNWVKEGQTYTIRTKEGSAGNGQRILLEEISNPIAHFPVLMGKAEPGFAQRRFVDWSDYILSQSVSEEVEVELENEMS